MAIKLSANYSKKLGLPNYSSHSFSASLEIELSAISQAEEEIQKLYALLQMGVDNEIRNPGYVPDQKPNGNNGHQRQHPQTNDNGQAKPKGEKWGCTEGQRGYILRLVNEHNLEKQAVEELSRQLFNIGVKELNKLQASQIIEELLAKVGKAGGRMRWQNNQSQPA